MTVIAPTITTDQPAMYARRLEQFLSFVPRIQIDITDGLLAPSQTLNLNQLYWPPADQRTTKIDLHLMLQRPLEWLDQIVSLTPDKVILHAESDRAQTTLPRIYEHLRKFGILTGLALLPDTTVSSVADLVKMADDVLIFGGRLGYQGGQADLNQLSKVADIRALNADAIIEWDGGANLNNVATIAAAGVDQINVGSAISSADDAAAAYSELVRIVN